MRHCSVTFPWTRKCARVYHVVAVRTHKAKSIEPLVAKLTEQEKVAFWARLMAGQDERGCWLWGKRRDTYYAFKGIPVHRLSYFLSRGVLASELDVLHSCDVPACGNPAHLRTGTDSDNAKDAHVRGRRSKSPRVMQVHIRLFPEDVEKVKRIAASKLIPWQTELRLLVHRALDVAIVNPHRSTSLDT